MPRQSVEGAIYCEKGLDADKISEFVNRGKFLADYQAEGVVHITNEELLTTKCDVLIPAASENQITEENAAKLNCRYERKSGSDSLYMENGCIYCCPRENYYSK